MKIFNNYSCGPIKRCKVVSTAKNEINKNENIQNCIFHQNTTSVFTASSDHRIKNKDVTLNKLSTKSP